MKNSPIRRRFRAAARGGKYWSILLIYLSLISCHDDGSGSQAISDEDLIVNFPFAHASYMSSEVTVTGTVVHPQAVKISVTASAGGARVERLTDIDGHFVIPAVPINTQSDEVIVEVVASHRGQELATNAFVLSRQPELASLAAIELDTVADRVIVVDRHTASVLSINLADGHREVLSSSGAPFSR